MPEAVGSQTNSAGHREESTIPSRSVTSSDAPWATHEYIPKVRTTSSYCHRKPPGCCAERSPPIANTTGVCEQLESPFVGMTSQGDTRFCHQCVSMPCSECRLNSTNFTHNVLQVEALVIRHIRLHGILIVTLPLRARLCGCVNTHFGRAGSFASPRNVIPFLCNHSKGQ
jgi:hypothetical protein